MNEQLDDEDNLIYNQEILSNWKDYCDNIQSQVSNMWNFLIYKNFRDMEINKLMSTITNLERELRFCTDDYDYYKNKYDIIKKDFQKFKLKKKDKNDNISIKRKRSEINLLEDEYNKSEDEYIPIRKAQKKSHLQDVYKKINSIKDIISLKNDKYKFDFLKDDKFNKLYNLIPCLEKLNNIIGMDNIKDSIYKSICYFIHGLNNNEELHHVIITGPPGVGKTTIAKIIGEIYLKLGFLENDTFITARRSDLIAKYLGQTAIKTQEVIDKASGGVLFIDEVYSLGNNEKRDSFSKECIDTINQNMTRLDHPWLLIIAGYKEEVTKSFLSYNPGLERRFTVRLNIEGYTAEELLQILLKFIKDENWNIDKDAIIVDDIKTNLNKFKFFAGDMRKLFQISKQNYSIRRMTTSTDLKEENKKLIRDDFIKSIGYFDCNNDNDHDMKEYIRRSMYL